MLLKPLQNEPNIGFRVQSALNPTLEIEHSLDLEHFKAATGQVLNVQEAYRFYPECDV